MGTFGYFWVLLGTFGYFWVLSGIFEYFWVLLGTFGYFWVLLSTFEYFWVLFGTFEYFWVFLGTFRYFWVLLGTFGYFYLKVVERFSRMRLVVMFCRKLEYNVIYTFFRSFFCAIFSVPNLFLCYSNRVFASLVVPLVATQLKLCCKYFLMRSA